MPLKGLVCTIAVVSMWDRTEHSSPSPSSPHSQSKPTNRLPKIHQWGCFDLIPSISLRPVEDGGLKCGCWRQTQSSLWDESWLWSRSADWVGEAGPIPSSPGHHHHSLHQPKGSTYPCTSWQRSLWFLSLLKRFYGQGWDETIELHISWMS